MPCWLERESSNNLPTIVHRSMPAPYLERGLDNSVGLSYDASDIIVLYYFECTVNPLPVASNLGCLVLVASNFKRPIFQQ